MDENVFEVTVKDLTSDGRGVVESPSGKVFFVAGVWKAETIKVQQASDDQGRAELRLLEVLKPSSARVVPPCRYQGHGADSCGGCAWQFIDYEAQLAAKQERVESQLARIGIVHRIEPIIASPNNLGYRNRAQFKTNGSVMGFVAARSNHIVDVHDCLVLDDGNRELLRNLRAQLPNTQWQNEGAGRWNTVDICAGNEGQTVSLNERLPFRQANEQQNARLKEWLRSKMGKLERSMPVLELFAGSGNLTELIADLGFETIVAVDVVADGVRRLQSRNLQGVQAMAADLYDASAFARVAEVISPAVLVLDPPRDGFRERGNLFEKQSNIKDIFYVSCDLATLCRDLAFLQSRQYKVREVQPLDMFPHTPHVELLVHLRKKGG